MKKIQIILIFSFLSLTIATQAQYRFLQGIAVFVGETSSRDRYINLYPQTLQADPLFLHAQPPSHKSAELEGFSVGIFLEMLRSAKWRWVTEIDLCNKGAVENELLNPITNEKRIVANHYTNIQWNNYIKRWIDLGFKFRTYAMLGARIEYTMGASTPAYSYISGKAAKLTVSPDIGIGAEFHLRGPWNLFVEEHYNPDIVPLYTTGKVSLWNRTWETRLGIIYRFKSGIASVDLDCNAPRYHRR
ncbi:MAG: hypothetical protein ABI388_06400 [Bacteroidia bacterium]